MPRSSQDPVFALLSVPSSCLGSWSSRIMAGLKGPVGHGFGEAGVVVEKEAISCGVSVDGPDFVIG